MRDEFVPPFRTPLRDLPQHTHRLTTRPNSSAFFTASWEISSRLPKAAASTATTCPGRNVLVVVESTSVAPRFLVALRELDMGVFWSQSDSPQLLHGSGARRTPPRTGSRRSAIPSQTGKATVIRSDRDGRRSDQINFSRSLVDTGRSGRSRA